jgi:hypothetical protein
MSDNTGVWVDNEPTVTGYRGSVRVGRRSWHAAGSHRPLSDPVEGGLGW